MQKHLFKGVSKIDSYGTFGIFEIIPLRMLHWKYSEF